MTTILSRSRWTSTNARGAAFIWSRIRGIVCHYPAAGKAIGVITQAQEASRLRGWRNYHVSGRGWADIGYNYGIGQSGRIYSLRGDRAGAHATGHNSTTVGVLFIVGDNEPLTVAAKKAFRDLRAHLRRKGCGAGLWGHQQMSGASTRCPGPYIMGSLRDGSLAAGSGGTSPAPVPTPEEEDTMPEYKSMGGPNGRTLPKSKWSPVHLKGTDVSLFANHTRFTGTLYLRIKGLPPGEEIHVEAVAVKGMSWDVVASLGKQEVIGTGGDTYALVPFAGYISKGERLRFRAYAFRTGVKIDGARARALYWKK